jgi:hypothetical protein
MAAVAAANALALQLMEDAKHPLKNVAMIKRLLYFTSVNAKRTIELAFVNQSFNDAVVNKSEDIFKRILADPADGKKLQAMVCHFCARGRVELVRACALHPCTVSIVDAHGWTPLHHAAFQCQVDVVKLICDEEKAPLNNRNNCGWGPLRCGVYHPDDTRVLKNLDVLCSEAVLKRGLDINATCDQGWNIAHATAQRRRVKLLKFVLDKGAAVDAVIASSGYTPLVSAIVNQGDESRQCVKLLLERGASLTARTKEAGRTPLMVAIGGPSTQSYAGSWTPDSETIALILDQLEKQNGAEGLKKILAEKDGGGKTAADLLGSASVTPAIRQRMGLAQQ